ncbi:hypothetical protein IMY05_004G0127600 [Salix suchowensis]|nr:hypothetical protein IMY05_004G0127600 [Salix suchowensis]
MEVGGSFPTFPVPILDTNSSGINRVWRKHSLRLYPNCGSWKADLRAKVRESHMGRAAKEAVICSCVKLVAEKKTRWGDTFVLTSSVQITYLIVVMSFYLIGTTQA